MPKYKVVYYENFYAEADIEAESPEEAKEIFWEQWGNDDSFVDEVLASREVTDSGVDIDPWA